MRVFYCIDCLDFVFGSQNLLLGAKGVCTFHWEAPLHGRDRPLTPEAKASILKGMENSPRSLAEPEPLPEIDASWIADETVRAHYVRWHREVAQLLRDRGVEVYQASQADVSEAVRELHLQGRG